MHVAAIRFQVDDRIADDLTRTVIRDVAAAPRFVNVDAARGQRLAGGENVRSAAVAANAERQHVRMFDEEKKVVDATGAAILDEHTLQRQRVGVRHQPEPANFKSATHLLHQTYPTHQTHLPF
jgi:hypothetical protein